MPTTKIKRLSIAAFSIAATCVLASWGYKQTNFTYQGDQQVADTIPKQKVVDFDETLQQLDEAERQLNGPELKAQIKAALSQVDAQKIKMDVQKAMQEAELALKSIDVAKIKAEVEHSLAAVNFEKIKPEIEKAMATAKVDMENALAEIKKIDKKTIEQEIKKAQVEMEKIKPEMEKAMKNMDKDLAKAKVEIEKARVDVKEYKSLVDGLEKDGWLDSKKNYTVEHKDGALYINGEKASAEVYKKHEAVLKKHPELKIKKTEKSFNITKEKQDGVEL